MLSSFGVSFFVHLLIILGLSLIAIGSGAGSLQSVLLIASSMDANEDVILSPEADWQEVTIAPDMLLDDMSDSLDLPSSLALTSATSSKPPSTQSQETLHGVSRQSPTNGIELAGSPSLAVAAIQRRVDKAGGKKGEVQFALAWKNVNDLDLHVIAPSGEHIAHTHRRSRCAGMLDVDMNIDGESEEPVENVRWLRKAPWGRYTVLINFFKLNSEGIRRPKRQTPYQLLAQLGSESIVREGVAGFGRLQVTVWRFHYVPESLPSIEREQMLKHLTLLQEQEELAAAPMLEAARSATGSVRQQMLQNLIRTYPHTDAAIQALQLMEGEVVKRSRVDF